MQLFTWDAWNGARHIAAGITKHQHPSPATAFDVLYDAIQGLPRGTECAVRLARIDFNAHPAPGYLYGPVLLRARRDARTGRVLIDQPTPGDLMIQAVPDPDPDEQARAEAAQRAEAMAALTALRDRYRDLGWWFTLHDFGPKPWQANRCYDTPPGLAQITSDSPELLRALLDTLTGLDTQQPGPEPGNATQDTTGEAAVDSD